MCEKFHFLVDEFTSKRVDETEMFLSKRVDKEIFVQTSAEPNDCVKPNEQNRVNSIFAMASNRTFKNLFGLCRAQPKVHLYELF